MSKKYFIWKIFSKNYNFLNMYVHLPPTKDTFNTTAGVDLIFFTFTFISSIKNTKCIVWFF